MPRIKGYGELDWSQPRPKTEYMYERSGEQRLIRAILYPMEVPALRQNSRGSFSLSMGLLLDPHRHRTLHGSGETGCYDPKDDSLIVSRYPLDTDEESVDIPPQEAAFPIELVRALSSALGKPAVLSWSTSSRDLGTIEISIGSYPDPIRKPTRFITALCKRINRDLQHAR